MKRGVTMNENPYASPVHVPEEEPRRMEDGRLEKPVPTRVRFGEVVRAAWRVYAGNKWKTGLLVCGVSALAAVPMIVWGIVLDTVSPSDAAVLMLMVGLVLASVIIGLGIVIIMRGLTRLVRGGEVRVRPIFPGWGVLGRVVAFVLVVVVAALLMFAAVMKSADVLFPLEDQYGPVPHFRDGKIVEEIGLIGRWHPRIYGTFCDIGTTLIVILWPTLTLPGLWLMVDRKMNPFAALMFSMRVILWNFLTVLMLLAWCTLLIAAGLAAAVVGLLWALPFVCVHGIMFCMLASGENVPYQPQA